MAYETYEFDQSLRPTIITGLNPPSDQYMKIDASISLRHEASATITQHPVEIGANISDFSIINPRTFILNGRISLVKPRQEGEDEDPNDVLVGSLYRVSEAWNRLELAMRTRLLLDFDTNLKVYNNMLITSISTSQDWRTARVLDFTANIQEIIIVAVKETELTEAQLKEGSTKHQASPTVELGDVQGTDIDDLATLGVA